MKLKEMLDLTLDEYNALPKTARQQISKRLSSVANRRVTRAIEEDYYLQSPSVMNAIKGKRGKNRLNPFKAKPIKGETDAQHYANLKSFLKNKTSTKQGSKTFSKKMEKLLGGKFRTKKVANAFWKEYNRWLETADGQRNVIHGKGGNSAEVIADFFESYGDFADKDKRGRAVEIPEDRENEIFAFLKARAKERLENGKRKTKKGDSMRDISKRR